MRSTVGTVTDTNALLRVLFSRLGQPHIGGPQAFSFNIPSVTGTGTITVERGSRPPDPVGPRRRDGQPLWRDVTVRKVEGQTETRSFTVAGGMCPRCEGMGTANDIDLTQLYDETKSLNEGDHRARLHGRWLVHAPVRESGLDPDKRIRDYTKEEPEHFLYREPTNQGQGGGSISRTRASSQGPEVVPLQGRRRHATAHSRVRRAGRDLLRLPGLRRHRLNDAARSSKVNGISIADACAMQISDWPRRCAAGRAVRRAAAGEPGRHPRRLR